MNYECARKNTHKAVESFTKAQQIVRIKTERKEIVDSNSILTWELRVITGVRSSPGVLAAV
jgi:hypothetical protein